MTIDFSATPENNSTNTESEGSVFAPIPSWERVKKRRGLAAAFGGRASRVAEEPRSFVSEPDSFAAQPDRALQTGALPGDQRAYAFDPVGPTDESAFVTAEEPAFAATPSYAGVAARRSNSAAPVAIAAGIVLLGGLAATGWYMSQPHTSGIAQLTPGGAVTTTTTSAAAPIETASNMTPQEALPAASASATAPAPAAPAVSHTTVTTTHAAPRAKVTHKTTVARARPASSASEASADVSARAPVVAAPAPPAAPTPAPVQAAPAPTPPLVLTLPPSAPAETTPAPIQTAPLTTTAPPTETPPQ